MARIRDYLQDENKPFGVGTFTLDDGSEYYLDDPERARSVLEEIGRESTNIAERGSGDRQGGELDKRQQLENAVAKLAGESEPNEPFRGIDTGPSSMRRAVAGPGGADEPTESRAPEPEENMSRMPEPPRPPPSEQELRDAESAQLLADADSLVSRTKGGTDPRALGPGVRVDKSFSRKGGLPMGEYDQQSQGRAMAHQAGNELVGQHYREDQAAGDLAASRLESEALAQRKANAQQALALQKTEEKYRTDRAWLEKDVDDYYAKKPDPDGGLRKERGPVGNIASAIAQFLGAYAAVISGSPNFANQILNRKIDEHVNAQVEDFRRGKMKRDGQLQRMAERGMSIDQIKSALKLQQELAIQKETKAAALREGSRESKQAAEALLMDRQERFINAENEYRTKALGEETVSGEMVRPTGPRMKTPLELMNERNALLEASLKGGHLARGGDYAVQAEERDIKRGEAQRTQQNTRDTAVSAYAKQQQESGAGLNKIDRVVERLDEIDRTNGGYPGIGRGDMSGAMPSWTDRGKLAEETTSLREALVNELVNATPGNKSDQDRINLALEALGDGTENGLRLGAQRAALFARDKRAALEAGASDEVRAEYQKRHDARLLENARQARDKREAREREEKSRGRK